MSNRGDRGGNAPPPSPGSRARATDAARKGGPWSRLERRWVEIPGPHGAPPRTSVSPRLHPRHRRATTSRPGSTAARRHALPARAERLPPHRPRQGDLPRTSASPQEYGGLCHLRFDDTNPATEERRVRRGDRGATCAGSASTGASTSTTRPTTSSSSTSRARADPARRPTSATSPPRRSRAHRGTLTEPGIDRARTATRTVAENLDLFQRMRAGEFADGARVLRAKIDMALAEPDDARPDPLPHPARRRTTAPATRWCIYPMYDFAHCLVGRDRGHHALALHARVRRPPRRSTTGSSTRSRSRIRARSRSSSRALNLSHTVMSKRKLRAARRGGARRAAGTIRACRRSRACAGAATRRRRSARFCDGRRRRQARQPDRARAARGRRARRAQPDARRARWRVLRPLKVVIENYPEGAGEELDAVNNPEDPAAGTRKVPFSRELCIERDDFLEDPPKKFFRLAPGREVRLRYAYFVTLHGRGEGRARRDRASCAARYDPATRGGDAPDGRKVKGTIHWVSARARAAGRGAALRDAVHVARPDGGARGATSPTYLNPRSLEVVRGALGRAEPRARAAPGDARAVRAPRLLLRRPRRDARRAGLEPHRHAARHLGEARARATRGSVIRSSGAPLDAGQVYREGRLAMRAGDQVPMIGNIKVISGTAHPELARDVCAHLGIEPLPLHRACASRTRTCWCRSTRTSARPTSS